MADSVFTSRFKRRNRIIGGLTLTIAGTSPFVIGLVLISYLGPRLPQPVAAGIILLAFLLAGLLPWRALDRLALLGNRLLRQQLSEKLLKAADGISSIGEAELVGFSPGEELRSWEGETDHDVGFLSRDAGALIYRGDAYSWTLRREAIDTIEALPAGGGLQRIVVKWHAPREPGRAFTLGSRKAQTLRSANRATVELLHNLQQWKNATGDAAGLSLPLGLPPTDTSGSYLVEKAPAGSCATLLAVTAIITLSIWHVTQRFISAGHYYHGILWAGLIAVGGAMFTVHFLGYLQSYEARLATK